MNNFKDTGSSNDSVINYLNYYFFGDSITDYAVLITGSWGSGKTYFIKNKIFIDDKERVKPLYVTLNGVTSITEITDQFFSQLHPRLSSKSVRMLGVFASRILNGYAGTEVSKDVDDKSIVKDVFLNINNRIIIFDDLERCLIPIQSILGYINSFVEHDGCKVLIVASEDDIPEEQKRTYYLKKEKVIGKTISLIPAIDEVIDYFCEGLKSQVAKKVIAKNKNTIISIIYNSGSVNFRSIRSIFDDFDRTILTFDKYFKSSSRAVIKLLTSMLALGIEYRAGNISTDDIGSIPTNSLLYGLSYSIEHNSLNIVEKYSSIEWFDPVVPYVSLAKIFSTGTFNTNDIEVHLSQHPLLSSKKHNQFWRELWSWTDLTRTKYIIALNGLKDQLERFEIVEPEVIMHVVGILLSLEIENDKYATSEVDVVDYCKKYIDEIKLRNILLPNISFFSDNYSSKYELGFISSDSVKFTEVKDYLKVAVNYRFLYSIKKIYPDLLFSMSENPEEYVRLYEYGINEGNYGGVAFLHLIPPGYFANMIINDWVCNGRLLSSLNEIYSRDKHIKSLDIEYLWLKRLMKITYNIADNAKEPQKAQLIKKLRYYFSLIEKNISFSKSV
ncbi:P-loop NTPase fold protein [Leclercia adecarboxylata]|uniref:P-loop NTPase fold protein n=1 Tax=Leclercia adecarboxylata TaxID=83655 RepID=UPI002B2B4838|nr:KAP family NTPase [Leclercia adecarboxylata]